MALIVVVALTQSILFIDTIAAAYVHNQLSFDVAPASGSEVKLEPDIACRFSWSATRNGTVESITSEDLQGLNKATPSTIEPGALTIDEVVATLRTELAKLDNCAKTNNANFVYELCLNRDCVQSLQGSPERWLLGRFDHSKWLTKDDIVALEIGDGELCKPNMPQLARSLVLYPQCGGLAFGNFREVSTCAYSATLSVPFACDPSMRKFLAGEDKLAAIKSTALARWEEASWLLEGGDTSDGRRFCTAYNTGAGSRTLHVSGFSLSLASDEKIDSSQCVAWAQYPNKTRVVVPDSAGVVRLDSLIDAVRVSCELKQ
jgi:hypothetical protein